ncbi:MAG: vitamin K epoxide reductase family protein, partial [Kofleriaceae bacterium]
MSDPILSPEVPHTGERGAPPLTILATRYPSGATLSLVLLLVLGATLLFLPNLLGYGAHPLAWSDRLSGGAVVALALAAAVTARPWISWIAGAIGLWIVLAPIALWAPSLAAYVAGTLIGAFVVLEGVVLPLSWITPGDEMPAGWSYNPSAWSQRLPVMVLATLGLLFAGYMAAFQLGAIGNVWDPIFGSGSERVLSSDVSRAWPVPDAGLGAAMFAIDLLMTCAGDRRRWRTMPWLVLLFGVMIIPIGIVSVVLVMLQPVAVGAWCSWCLLTAAATLAMIPLAVDEVTATLQLLRQTSRRRESWWRVLWRGAHHGAARAPLPRHRKRSSVPWSLVVMAAAGAWLMIEPSIIDMPQRQADSGHVAGALVIVVAAVAVSEIARPLRFLALPLSLWILVVPLITVGAPYVTWWTGLASALAVALTAWPRGAIAQRHGSA